MPRRRQRGAERRIALERIGILFRLAEHEARRRNSVRARRYVDLARRIGMRYNVRMPRQFKRTFCRVCQAFLVPSLSARVRVGRGHLVVTCAACGKIQRYPYRREQVARKKIGPRETAPAR